MVRQIWMPQLEGALSVVASRGSESSLARKREEGGGNRLGRVDRETLFIWSIGKRTNEDESMCVQLSHDPALESEKVHKYKNNSAPCSFPTKTQLNTPIPRKKSTQFITMTEDKPPKTQQDIDSDNVEYERLAAIHNTAQPRWLTPTIQLSPWLPSDRDALVLYLNTPEIYSYINGPPFPYLPSDADAWIRGRPYDMTKNGTPLNYCIRDMSKGGKPIGSVYVSADSDDNLEDNDDLG